MASPPKVNGGFTLLEVLIALTFAAFLLGVTAAAAALDRHALRTSGTEDFNGRTLAISPDDSLGSAAHLLAAELASLNAQADFTVALDQPWNPADLATRVYLPVLQNLDSATLGSPSALRTALAAAGIPFTGQGYTLLFIGRQFRLLGALTVTARAASAANGDLFCDYQTRLFGDSGAGFGELYQYEFVSADLNKQPLVGPTAAAGCWAIVLPDPELAAEKPDGTVLTNPQSTLVYALPANLP